MDDVCLYSNPVPIYFDLLQKKGLNIEDCCKCDGQGLNPLCPFRYIVPKDLKNTLIYEQRYLYSYFNALIPVRS